MTKPGSNDLLALHRRLMRLHGEVLDLQGGLSRRSHESVAEAASFLLSVENHLLLDIGRAVVDEQAELPDDVAMLGG